MTRDRIGFDRTIRLHWLDQAALLAGEVRDGVNLHAALTERLAGEIAGRDSRERTANVLTRLWWRVPRDHVSLRDEALAHIASLEPEERLAYHWGMALLAYPFFRDVAGTIGRLLRLQGTFRLAQLSQRITAGWGNRTTLEYALARVIRSLQDWGVLQSGEQRGSYVAAPTTVLSTTDSTLWLLEAVLRARGTELPASDLLRAPESFPFDTAVALSDLARSPRFLLHQGGQDFVTVQLAR